MSLRLRLTFALMVAALLPMVVAVGVTMLRAERRAQQEAAVRLQAARRQAEVLIDRHKKDVLTRLERAAADLPHEFFGLDTLLKRANRPETAGKTPTGESTASSGESAAISGGSSASGQGGASPALALPPTEGASPATSGASMATGSASPTAGSPPPKTDSPSPKTGSASPQTGGASAATGSTSPATGAGASPGDRRSTHEIARALAERHGLDYLEILDGDGRVLATSRMDVPGLHSPLTDLAESDVSLRPVPQYPPGNQASAVPVAPFARLPVPLGNEPL